MPLRGNGWYYHNMICYCIENDKIKLDNIKYVIKSSLSLKKDYCNKLLIIVIQTLKITVAQSAQAPNQTTCFVDDFQ